MHEERRGEQQTKMVKAMTAEFRATPGRRGELRDELLLLVKPTRAEDGCLQYDLHESIERRGRLYVLRDVARRGRAPGARLDAARRPNPQRAQGACRERAQGGAATA